MYVSAVAGQPINLYTGERHIKTTKVKTKKVIHFTSTTKIKSLIYLRRIIDSDTRKKIDGVAVAFITRRDPLAGGCLMMYS